MKGRWVATTIAGVKEEEGVGGLREREEERYFR